jgi:hypothetical protein
MKTNKPCAFPVRLYGGIFDILWVTYENKVTFPLCLVRDLREQTYQITQKYERS